MKAKKRRYLSLLILCCICALTIACYEFFNFSKKDEIVNPKYKITATPETIDRLAGTWIRQDNPSYRIVFGPGTSIKIQKTGASDLKGTFDIAASCDGVAFDGNPEKISYLKIMLVEQDLIVCEVINKLEGDRLELTPSGGKMKYEYRRK